MHVRHRAESLKQRRVSPLEPYWFKNDGLHRHRWGVSILPSVFPDSFPSLRQHLRATRRALSAWAHRHHAAALMRQLLRNLRVRRSRNVALYWPTDGEIDPRPLMQSAAARAKRFYLPVLHPLKRRVRAGGALWFARYRPGERLRPKRFGIPEPTRRGAQLIRVRQLDLMLVPLVGFTISGQRLGMGGGFYDRTLAIRQRVPRWQRPRLIGVAHACQRLDRLESRPWDVRLDAVLTESDSYTRLP